MNREVELERMIERGRVRPNDSERKREREREWKVN